MEYSDNCLIVLKLILFCFSQGASVINYSSMEGIEVSLATEENQAISTLTIKVCSQHSKRTFERSVLIILQFTFKNILITKVSNLVFICSK